jgi:hypothetical protein
MKVLVFLFNGADVQGRCCGCCSTKSWRLVLNSRINEELMVRWIDGGTSVLVVTLERDKVVETNESSVVVRWIDGGISVLVVTLERDKVVETNESSVVEIHIGCSRTCAICEGREVLGSSPE